MVEQGQIYANGCGFGKPDFKAFAEIGEPHPQKS
jgi:hypothetical protein